MNPGTEELFDDAPAFPGAHVRQDGPGHADEAEDADVEDALRLGGGAFLGGAGGAGTGVAGQDIDAPEPPDHLLGHRAGRLAAGHVQIEEPHARRQG
jgi:hypothetical protein